MRLIALAFAAPLFATTAYAAPADLVIWGGPIYTGSVSPAKAEAVAVSNGRIVGDVVWLADRGPYEAKSAAISEAVLVVGHAGEAHRRFLVFGEEWDALSRWLSRYRGVLDGVEIWFLAGDKLERLA